MQSYVVGISGGSASGKTYLINALKEAFNAQELTLISQDNYYKPKEQQYRDENGDINFDHPDALDLEKCANDLKKILNGQTIQVKEYNFNNPAITPKYLTYAPAPIIVVEGLFVFHHPPLRNIFQLKIFIEADEHIRLTRRIRRDVNDRGYPLEEILEQYVRFVVPMYRQYVEPYKYICDLILPNHHEINGVKVIINHLKHQLNQARAQV